MAALWVFIFIGQHFAHPTLALASRVYGQDLQEYQDERDCRHREKDRGKYL